MVRNDNTIVFYGLDIDLPPNKDSSSRAKQRVEVHSSFEGAITVKHGPDRLAIVLPLAKTIKTGPRAQSIQISSADRIPEPIADRI